MAITAGQPRKGGHRPRQSDRRRAHRKIRDVSPQSRHLWRPDAKLRASSSRSSPRKISEPIANVGAPKMPSARASLVPSCNRRSLSAPLARATIGPADLGLCLAAVPIFCDREFSRKLSVSYGQPSQMVSSPMCQALTKELRQGRLPLTFPQREQKFHAARNEQIRKPMRDGPCCHDVQHGFLVL